MSKTGLRFDRSQLDFLKKSEKKMFKASATAIANTGKTILRSIQSLVDKKPYSLQQLKGMDHPYARRHGSIKGLSDREPYAVAKVSGKFASSIIGKTTNQYEYAIRYQANDSTKRIVEGTRIMLPRDPINMGFKSKGIQQQFKKTIRTEFKKAMK